jgi:predicted small secreted protein
VYQTGLDCLEYYPDVPGLTSCEYETYVDSCTGEEDKMECYAYITVDGVDYDDWCDVLESYFSNTETCDWVYQTGLDCLEYYPDVPGLTSCEYETYVDSCTGEEDMM